MIVVKPIQENVYASSGDDTRTYTYDEVLTSLAYLDLCGIKVNDTFLVFTKSVRWPGMIKV